MSRSCVVLLVVAYFCSIGVCQKFIIPTVQFEVFHPKGFIAYIPDAPGIQLFAFHARLNEPIKNAEPGTFSGDAIKPENGRWLYRNEDAELHFGDKLYYWIFVQHNQFGYRKDAQEYTVSDFGPTVTPRANVSSKDNCTSTATTIYGIPDSLCGGALIFEDNFAGSGVPDSSKWTVEHFIPAKSKEFEFVSYQNKRDVLFLADGKLKIKLKPLESEGDVRGVLDLREGCTGTGDECRKVQNYYLILPPVISGKIRSNFKFQYGKVEIKAKLPEGDWIYPQLRLKSDDAEEEIWISYARGNDVLTGDEGDDIGCRLLFAGVVTSNVEPERSKFLRSVRNTTPYTQNAHVFTLIWTSRNLTFLVDGVNFGYIDVEEENLSHRLNTKQFYLSLGVGVGGLSNFPDGYRSGDTEKPWGNTAVKNMKQFFDARSHWLPTWKGSKSVMEIDYVKIYAI